MTMNEETNDAMGATPASPVPQAAQPTQPAAPQAAQPTQPTAPQAAQPTQPTTPQATQPTQPAVPQAAQPVQPVGTGAPQPPQGVYSQPTYQTGYQAAPQQRYYSQPTATATTPAAKAKTKPAKNGHTKTFWTAFAGAAAACLLAVLCVVGVNAVSGGSSTQVVGGSTVIGSTANTPVVTDDDTQLAEAVSEKVLPSIVCVDVYVDSSTLGGYGYGYGSGSSSDGTVEAGLGSGIIISTDGYILTNYHVVEDSSKLMITIGDTDYEARIVGTDPSSDLAVVKIDASGLHAIEIGNSSDLKTGEWVMSAGAPFGLEESVATGIVSATSRTVSDAEGDSSGYSSSSAIYTNMIQTDAAINPGNSGGALVDADGKLIGINTLIASYSGNYSGVGFAIPVDYAIDIAQQIIDGKTPSHAQLGVAATTVNSTNSQRYGLAVDAGAYVSTVYPNSGAADAGMKEGDIITKFNGNTVKSASDLTADVRSCSSGDTVDVEINRDGTTSTLKVTLGTDEGTTSSSSGGNSYGYGSGSGNGSGNGYSGQSYDLAA